MNKSTITRERLEELAAGQSGFNLRIATHEESQELARMALAAMDSEPVAWMHNNNNIGIPAITTSPKIGQYWMSEFKDVQPLYRHAQQPVAQPVMFIDGDISSDDADKLAKVIREFNEEDERPLAKMARTIRENPHPTNECDMPKAPEYEPVKRFNADQMHRICLEANRHLDKYSAMAKEVNKLLGRIPAQTAPVVPEEWTLADAFKFCKETGRQDAGAAMEAWNACRAAMLQNVTLANEGDIQAGNSLEIPEGYVLVPREPTDEMIAAAMDCDDVLFNSDETFCVQFGNIYEAMTAAAPQEVTSARVHPARE